MKAPKPASRPDRVGAWQYLRLFRQDILSAQPARLFRAWMAEFRTPFFRSFLVNQPDLVATVLKERPYDFPKSMRVSAGLRPLLGRSSVFLTNGQLWERQRRILNPAFEGGRLRDSFPAMKSAVQDAVGRMKPGEVDVEAAASHLAADIIFRTLFSVPISDRIASETYEEFRRFQSAQPILNAAAFWPILRHLPGLHRNTARQSARRIRKLITSLVDQRLELISSSEAPDDLATRIIRQQDPETGQPLSRSEMIDQVAIFFLAGHETSAAALSWALYLLAADPSAQARVAEEADGLPGDPGVTDLAGLEFTRNVFRETLRLYPPVPMMVRQCQRPESFRNRSLPEGSQVVISPWHLHRHERIWERPDDFDPDRYSTENGRACLAEAYIPFSAGPRVCVGAGFAMTEGVLSLALICRNFRLAPVEGPPPVPRAFLTVRSADGIRISVSPR